MVLRFKTSSLLVALDSPRLIDRALQVHGIPQNDGGYDEIQATGTIALVFIGSFTEFRRGD